MNENRISLEMSEGDVRAVNDAIRTLTEKLQPFLIALEAGDKQALTKMKDKSIPFVEKVMQYVESNPEFVPPFLDVPEMKKDFSAFTTVNQFLQIVAISKTPAF